MSACQGKHTPGPWSVCGNGECSCKTIMCADHPIAVVTHGEWGDDYPAIRLVGTSSLDQKAEAYMEQITYGEIGEELARANALLIAAAPDLLATLKALVFHFTDDGQSCGRPELEVFSKARAAIAKAENGDPEYEAEMELIRKRLNHVPRTESASQGGKT